MTDNLYSVMTSRLVTVLAAGLTQYTGLVVDRRRFHPENLPAFTGNYMIIVSPSSRPWGERIVSVRTIQDTLRCDLFLLVKNFHTDNSLFGLTTPDFGIFQMIEDMKALLRVNTLSSLLDMTYEEVTSEVDFEDLAIKAHDTGEYTWIHRARQPYIGRMRQLCHPTAV